MAVTRPFPISFKHCPPYVTNFALAFPSCAQICLWIDSGKILHCAPVSILNQINKSPCM